MSSMSLPLSCLASGLFTNCCNFAPSDSSFFAISVTISSTNSFLFMLFRFIAHRRRISFAARAASILLSLVYVSLNKLGSRLTRALRPPRSPQARGSTTPYLPHARGPGDARVYQRYAWGLSLRALPPRSPFSSPPFSSSLPRVPFFSGPPQASPGCHRIYYDD